MSLSTSACMVLVFTMSVSQSQNTCGSSERLHRHAVHRGYDFGTCIGAKWPSWSSVPCRMREPPGTSMGGRSESQEKAKE